MPTAAIWLLTLLLSAPIALAQAQAKPPKTLQGWTICQGAALAQASGERGRWRHKRNRAYALLGSARHSAGDLVAPLRAKRATFEAKFSFGKTRKDITDERVRVYLDTCKAKAVLLGEGRTDKDGWLRFALAAPQLQRAGVYTITAELLADGSTARAELWVLPKKTKIAVFDIDGTLTVSDAEAGRQLGERLLARRYTPKAYPGGAKLTKAWSAKKTVPLYLSGRPYWFVDVSRSWLRGLHFARGPVLHTRRHRQMLTSETGVARFKRETLKSLKQLGFELVAGHGNALTDLSAYLGAGLPAARIWIIGAHGGKRGSQAVAKSWTELVRAVQRDKLPRAAP